MPDDLEIPDFESEETEETETNESTETEESEEPETETEETEDESDESSTEDQDETDEDEDDEDTETDSAEEVLTVSNLTKAFPKIGEKFPELIPILQKAEKYEQIFDTPEEANTARELVAGLEYFNEALAAGDAQAILTNMFRANSNGAGLFVENLLPTLYKQNREIYSAVTFPAVVLALKTVAHSANLHGNKNLGIAVRMISQALTGKQDLPEVNLNIKGEGVKEKKEDSDPRSARLQEHFESTTSAQALSRVDKFLQKEVVSRLPGDPLTKKLYLQSLKGEVMSQMDKDPQYLSIITKLHEQAKKADFLPGAEIGEKISRVFLQRFQALMAPSLRKLLKEAGMKFKEDSDKGKKVKKFVSGKGKDDNKVVKIDKNKPPRHPSVAGDSDWLRSRMGN